MKVFHGFWQKNKYFSSIRSIYLIKFSNFKAAKESSLKSSAIENWRLNSIVSISCRFFWGSLQSRDIVPKTLSISLELQDIFESLNSELKIYKKIEFTHENSNFREKWVLALVSLPEKQHQLRLRISNFRLTKVPIFLSIQPWFYRSPICKCYIFITPKFLKM